MLIRECSAIKEEAKPTMQQFAADALGYVLAVAERQRAAESATSDVYVASESKLLLKTTKDSDDDKAARILLLRLFKSTGFLPESQVDSEGSSMKFLVRHYPLHIQGRRVGAEIMRLTYTDTKTTKYLIHEVNESTPKADPA